MIFNKYKNIEIFQDRKTITYTTIVGNYYYLYTPFTSIKMDIIKEYSINVINLQTDNKIISVSVTH